MRLSGNLGLAKELQRRVDAPLISFGPSLGGTSG
jgi:hypothetical protein